MEPARFLRRPHPAADGFGHRDLPVRQLFLTIPEELLEAAKIDGASPMRFLIDVLWPMSRTNVVALTVILFVFGWNQYLWPLLITPRPA